MEETMEDNKVKNEIISFIIYFFFIYNGNITPENFSAS